MAAQAVLLGGHDHKRPVQRSFDWCNLQEGSSHLDIGVELQALSALPRKILAHLHAADAGPGSGHQRD
jgi:hypothetical protein